MTSILSTLNIQQKEAVEYITGPSLVIAGAGSGKTRVLTFKIAYLLQNEYDPEKILALTFTNKAAREIKERVIKLVGKQADKMWMGTFHSIFAKILRTEIEKIGYKRNFSIYDAEDSSSLVSNVITELNLPTENFSASSIHRKISYYKNQMIGIDEYRKTYAKNNLDQKFADIYQKYIHQMRENNALDFDDLLLKPIELFNENPKILQKYKKSFDFILVDEFQDTNKAQYEIIKMLSGSSKKICVVGDDAQSIYGWRGAEIKNILNFEKDFPKTKIFRLEQNYRSTKIILRAAGSVIKNNSEQINKNLWTENQEGEKLHVVRCSDEKDEAFQIIKYIKKETATKKLSFNHFTILYRINSQSRALEEGFRRERIPYSIVGGVEFYKRKEIKDVIAYLRVISNQNDEESLLRIMNFPQRGIGNTSLARMIAFARKLDISLYTTMARIFEVIDVKERIQKNVKMFKSLLDKYISLKDKLSLAELTLSLVDELGILKIFKEENTPESISRYENVQELMSAINQYNSEFPKATVENYLSEVSLIAGIDQYNENKNFVTMMTIHSAKGLEFPYVFITGCEEDIFPLANKFEPDSRVEEERRLFYVALTRAQQKIYLTHARSRYRFGEVAYQSRSRFIDEIDPDTVAEINGGIGRKSGPRKNQKSEEDEQYLPESYFDYNQENRSLRVGSKVVHESFGQGKILQIVGTGDMQKIVVNFEEYGTKHLLSKMAKLKLV